MPLRASFATVLGCMPVRRATPGSSSPGSFGVHLRRRPVSRREDPLRVRAPVLAARHVTVTCGIRAVLWPPGRGLRGISVTLGGSWHIGQGSNIELLQGPCRLLAGERGGQVRDACPDIRLEDPQRQRVDSVGTEHLNVARIRLRGHGRPLDGRAAAAGREAATAHHTSLRPRGRAVSTPRRAP